MGNGHRYANASRKSIFIIIVRQYCTEGHHVKNGWGNGQIGHWVYGLLDGWTFACINDNQIFLTLAL
jgi:hypothetical protein